jgi:hypothetical protein
VEQLEAELGRKMSFPLSPTDSNMILTSLAVKNLSVGTITSYLAGTKRMATTRGPDTPPPSGQARSILKGYENLQRDAKEAVVKNTHRPVTIHLLRLLGHVANTY